MSYLLVNPIIQSKSIKSKKKLTNDAAEDIWSQFSTNVKNYTPEFYFSLFETGSKKIHHYQVNESLENNKVKYSLKKYKNKKLNDKEFVDTIVKHLEQDGGKHHKTKQSRSRRNKDDDSSSSSSSDDNLVFRSHKTPRYPSPLAVTYYPTIYGVPNIPLPPLVSSYSYIVGTNLGSSVLGLFPYKRGHYEWKED